MVLHNGKLSDWFVRVTFYILYPEARQFCLTETLVCRTFRESCLAQGNEKGDVLQLALGSYDRAS